MATEPLVASDTVALQPLGGTTQAPAQAPAQAPTDNAAFRRLLESLEQLTKDHREVPPVADTDQMQAAIQRVDDGFTTAMDLRRKLEEAFRGRLP